MKEREECNLIFFCKDILEKSGLKLNVDEDITVRVLSESLYLLQGSIMIEAKKDQCKEHIFHMVVLKKGNQINMLSFQILCPDSDHSYIGCMDKAGRMAQNRCAVEELKDKVLRLENLTKNMPGSAHQCALDHYFTLINVSDSFLSMFGYNREEIKELFHDQFIQMIHPADRLAVAANIFEQIKQSNMVEAEYRVLRKDRAPVWVLEKSRIIEDEWGNKNFYCILIDITEQKLEKEELRLSLERHQVIMDQATDIIFEWDIRTDNLMISSNWKKRFGYEPMGENISQKIFHSKNIHPEDLDTFAQLTKDVMNGKSYLEKEMRIRNKDNQFIWCRFRATTQFDHERNPIKVVGVIVDISSEKKEKQELIHMAQMDALTGLYNKATIQSLIEQRINSGEEEMHAMIIIDIDNFKTINDNYGHLCGDILLTDIANVLKRNFRARDMVGRIGGDEFLIMMTEVADRDAVRLKLNNMIGELHKINLNHDDIAISCSIGVVVCFCGEKSFQTLYHQADIALYRQKRCGKNGATFYEEGMDSLPDNAEEIQSAVGTAIVSDDLSMVEEKLAQYTFRMLYQSSDIRTSIQQLLEIVGNSYDVSRVYIFESAPDGLYCSNTFEWCAPGIRSEMEHLQNLSYEEDLACYQENFNKDSIFYCKDIKLLKPVLCQLLGEQGICSMLQCAIVDRGVFKGFVGFDECRENRNWTNQQIATLTLISNVLAVFLTKLRLEEQIQAMEEQSRPSL